MIKNQIVVMIKKQSIVISVLLLSFTLVRCQVNASGDNITKEPVTELMVIEQQQMCLDAYEVEKINNNVNLYIDTTSVSDIKKQIKKSYEYFLNNKDDIIKQLEKHQKYEDDEFLSLTKLYLPDEEHFYEKENMYEELVNNNHTNYRDTILTGVYFNQVFKNNTSSLETKVRNNGATIFKFDTEETVQPHYSLNFHSEKELKIMNIYYHDGTVDSNETTIPEYSFPLNSIPVNKMKHIDSLQMEFKVMYVSEIDSVHFDKNEIGVKKGDFKLLKMENNYVEYETPNDYYPYHIGSILEEEFYNKEGKVLSTSYGISNLSLKTAEEDYNARLNLKRDVFEYTYIVNTKEEIANALKYVYLKDYNVYLKETRKQKITLEGNAESFTIYQEKRRDTITFLATHKNLEVVKQLYVHKLEDKTEFIDNNGKMITSIPSSIDFLYFSKERTYSDKYFFIDTDKDSYSIDDIEYYYLDGKKQIITKLPYSNIDFICKSIIKVSKNDSEGFQLLSTEENKLLSDEVFNSFIMMSYTGEGILVYNDEGSFLLLDQNGDVITENSEIVTKITLKKVEY